MLEREGGRVVEGRVEFGSVEELLADEDEVRQWDHWLLGQWQQRTEESLEEALREDGPGHEKGGLEGGHEQAMLGRLMECITPELEVVLADARARMAEGLPSGPEYAQPPGCNPERFQDIKQEFVRSLCRGRFTWSSTGGCGMRFDQSHQQRCSAGWTRCTR